MFILHKTKLSADIESIKNISQIDTLKAKDYRVLFLLMGHLDGRTAKSISLKKIASQLGLEKSDVIKSINRLISEELIIVESNEHVKDGYKFNF